MILFHCPRKLREWAFGKQKFPCLEGLEVIADCVKAERVLGRLFGSFVMEEEEGYHPSVAHLVPVVSQNSWLC